jgi:hypothetical protein
MQIVQSTTLCREFPGYEILSHLFRPAIPLDHPSASWDPGDPHTPWRMISPCVGLATTPPIPAISMMFASEYTGRLIRFQIGGPQREERAFAMVSLRPSVRRVPPHPGIRPPELEEFCHPFFILSDGTHGPYQASRYPQEFDPHRPWIPFHLFPKHEHDFNMEFLNPRSFTSFVEFVIT